MLVHANKGGNQNEPYFVENGLERENYLTIHRAELAAHCVPSLSHTSEPKSQLALDLGERLGPSDTRVEDSVEPDCLNPFTKSLSSIHGQKFFYRFPSNSLESMAAETLPSQRPMVGGEIISALDGLVEDGKWVDIPETDEEEAPKVGENEDSGTEETRSDNGDSQSAEGDLQRNTTRTIEMDIPLNFVDGNEEKVKGLLR